MTPVLWVTTAFGVATPTRVARPLGAAELPFQYATRRCQVVRGHVVAQHEGGNPQQDPDRFLNELEEELQRAVDSEHFEEAAQARRRLEEFMLERGDVNGVLNRNREFYEAFSTRDVEKMASIWFNDDHVQCVHAGHKPIRGYDNIMAGFRGQFRAVRQLTVSVDDVRVTVRGSTAWVLCSQRMRHAPTGSNRALTATNIFRSLRGQWYLVHHHAGFVKSPMGIGGAFGSEEGRITDAAASIPVGSVEDISGLIGRVIDGSGGPAHILHTSGSDDGILLQDDETVAEELARGCIHFVCELAAERALTSRQKRLLISDIIENDGEETPVRAQRACRSRSRRSPRALVTLHRRPTSSARSSSCASTRMGR